MQKMYKYIYLFISITFVCGFINPLFSQIVDFQSSDLPILIIDSFGEEIPDEPKIEAHLGIIDNGEGNRNFLTDSFNGYNGVIGIELRGYSSQTWPKKPYGFETRDSLGENNNVSLLGIPLENDWTLHAPYVDKTLMRNVLMYQLANEMGMYAPKTRFCELIVNDEYMGVFVLIEKIKKDKNRVDISKPNSANITGGYLLEMTSTERFSGGENYFDTPISNKQIEIKYPKSKNITAEQNEYIKNYFSDFESALFSSDFKDSVNGYQKFIDVDSFINNMLLAEGFNQLDALSFSQFFHKPKDGKLIMGPVWDFNRSIGNARYYTSWETSGWWLKHPYAGARAMWAERLMSDGNFLERYAQRWLELRETVFNLDSIYSKIDHWVTLLEESRVRNFEKWQVLGVSINNKYAFDTYEEEIDYIKNWIREKFLWLDDKFASFIIQKNQNLAFNNLYNFSSQEEGDENPASNAVDGNLETRWSALSYPQWIEIDLEEVTQINVLEVVPYKERAYQYIIESKNDINGNYEIIVDRNSNTTGGTVISDSINSKNARFVKLTVNGSYGYDGDWISILEFGIYSNSTTDIKDKPERLIPNKLTLYQSYPNPFNPSATIEYEIATPGDTKLYVYNVNGELITKLVDKFQKRGNYSVKFDGQNIPSAVYFYQLINNNQVETKSMILLK
ncbi:MAG: CotH kinase family protein [Melioribacteraceae bacterium]|nr:CotH kinase family protein [Melioribacteraceae bacterium]